MLMAAQVNERLHPHVCCSAEVESAIPTIASPIPAIVR